MRLKTVVEVMSHEDCMDELCASVGEHGDGEGVSLREVLLFRCAPFAVAAHHRWLFGPQERYIKIELSSCKPAS